MQDLDQKVVEKYRRLKLIGKGVGHEADPGVGDTDRGVGPEVGPEGEVGDIVQEVEVETEEEGLEVGLEAGTDDNGEEEVTQDLIQGLILDPDQGQGVDGEKNTNNTYT